MSSGHQRIKWRRSIAENFNRLSRVHERYRRQTDRHTDDDIYIANMNMSSRSLKTNQYSAIKSEDSEALDGGTSQLSSQREYGEIKMF